MSLVSVRIPAGRENSPQMVCQNVCLGLDCGMGRGKGVSKLCETSRKPLLSQQKGQGEEVEFLELKESGEVHIGLALLLLDGHGGKQLQPELVLK